MLSPDVRRGKVFWTQFGWLALLTDAWKVKHLKFGFRSEFAARRHLETVSCSLFSQGNGQGDGQGDDQGDDWPDELARRIQAYSEGEIEEFRNVNISLDGLTDFQRRVILECKKIPFGATSTYGEIARRVGSPGAARAVGSVMAKNCVPLIVPCHRVLASGGRLGGYSAIGGLTTKRRLLDLEAAALRAAQ
jgi:methylated-DNA-[protein]-cysteine S-methyltransferase